MRVAHVPRTVAGVVAAAALVAGGAATASAATDQAGGLAGHSRVGHVLLISVDGLHQQDLTWYVKHFPGSTLASLVRRGVEYSDAMTPVPSDSFPGLAGQATGGDPRVTGVYYDDTWNHAVFPAGTTHCSGPPPGGEVSYTEALDLDPLALDAGQGLSGLPGSILQMTSNPLDVINPAALPVAPGTCKPIYPNSYLKVNTIFEVARQHGLRTAWSDKHPAYQILSGPSGKGVQEFFTPEINSQAIGFPAGEDWTSDNNATMQYDSFKVHAVLNWIDGFNHSRTRHIGVPAIFGMNFQTVSTAQKLPTSNGLTGGYLPGGKVPGPLLVRALSFINVKGQPITVSASGLQKVFADAASAAYFGVPRSDPRHPDVFGIVQHGVVYTGGMSKIAEHGGAGREDRHVPILVVGPG